MLYFNLSQNNYLDAFEIPEPLTISPGHYLSSSPVAIDGYKHTRHSSAMHRNIPLVILTIYVCIY